MKKILFLVVAIILVFVILYFVNKGKEKTQPEATQDNSKKRIQKVLDRAGGYTNYYTINQNKFGPDFEPNNKGYVETLKNRAVEFGRSFEQELGIDSIWDQNRTGVKTTWGDVTQEEFNIARRIIIENKYPNWKAA